MADEISRSLAEYVLWLQRGAVAEYDQAAHMWDAGVMWERNTASSPLGISPDLWKPPAEEAWQGLYKSPVRGPRGQPVSRRGFSWSRGHCPFFASGDRSAQPP